MKKSIAEKIKLTVLILSVLLAILFYISKQVVVVNNTKTIDRLRKELIEKDSIVQITEGLYKGSVNDNYTLKELTESLKKENKKLHRELKDLNNRLLSYQSIVVKPKDKVDTIIIDNSYDFNFIQAYYPNKDDIFVRFTREVKNSTYIDEWKFNPIGIDIVLTEQKNNDFSVFVNAPEWLTINSTSVKATPLPPVKPDNFDWYTGLRVNNKLNIGVDLGVRYKKNIYYFGADTNSNLWLGFSRMW